MLKKLLPEKWRRTGDRRHGSGHGAEGSVDLFAGARHVTISNSVIQAAGRIENNSHDDSTKEIQDALQRLREPHGCSWDPLRACLSGTRVVHVGEIVSWADTFSENSDRQVPSDSAVERVLVVGGPVGSGKTALAHTICKEMEEKKLLVMSVFFSQTQGQQLRSEDFMAAFVRGLCEISPHIKQRIGELIVENPTLATSSTVSQFKGLVLPIIQLLPTKRTFVIGIDALDEQPDEVILVFLRDYVPLLPPTFRFVLTTRPVRQVMEHLENQSHIYIFPRSLTGDASEEDIFAFDCRRRHTTEGLFLWAETVLSHIGNSYDPPAELADIVKGASSRHWLEAEKATKQLEALYQHILSKLPWTDPRFVDKYRVIMGALVTLVEPMSVRGLSNLYAPDGITEDDVHRICTFVRPLLQNYQQDNPQKAIRVVHFSVKEFLTQHAPSPYRLCQEDHHLTLSRLSLMTIKKELLPVNFPILGVTEGDWVWDATKAPPKIPTISKDAVIEHLWYACRNLGGHELLASEEGVDDLHGALLYEVVVENPRFLLEASASMLHKAVSTSADIRKTIKVYISLASCIFPHPIALGLVKEVVRLYRQFTPSHVDPAMEFEYTVGLLRLAGMIFDHPHSNEQLDVAEEALKIPPGSASQNLGGPAWGSLLLFRSFLLHRLKRHTESYDGDLNAIDIFRSLQSTQSGKYHGHLTAAFIYTGRNLLGGGRYEETVPYFREAVERRRLLANDDPEKYEADLAEILLQYGLCCALARKATEALEPGRESVMHYRRLVEKDPSRFDPQLANSLNWLAWLLSECGRYNEAVPISRESVDIRRRLAETHPEDYEASLASSLHSHANYLSKSPITLAESIEVVREAADIRRRLVHQDPHHVDGDGALAESLRSLVASLAECGRHSEAAPIARESVGIHRRLAENNPADYEPYLANSLHEYAEYLLKSPSTLAESIELGQEAVKIRRRLAHQEPDRFIGALSFSLYNLAWSLAECGRHMEAVPVAKESVDINRRRAETQPALYEGSLANCLHGYSICLSRSPNTLAESIKPGQEAVEILRRLKCNDDPQRFDRILAESLSSLAWSLAECGRYIEAVPNAKESVGIHRRLAQRNPVDYEASLASSLHNYALYLSRSPITLAESIEPGREAVEIRRRLAHRYPHLLDEDLAQSLFNLALSLAGCGRHSEAVPIAKESVNIHRRLAEIHPADCEAYLATALLNYALLVSQSPTTLAESIEPSQEATEIRRRLAHHDPHLFDEDLAQSLFNLALSLTKCGRHSEAVPIFMEEVETRRRLVERDRKIHEPLLADALDNYARNFTHIPGREHEVLSPAQESVEIYRRLLLEAPTRSVVEGLGMVLGMVAHSLNACQRYADALPFALDGLNTYRGALEEGICNISDRRSNNLHKAYADALIGLGRGNEAVAPLKDAIVLYQRLLETWPMDDFYSWQLHLKDGEREDVAVKKKNGELAPVDPQNPIHNGEVSLLSGASNIKLEDVQINVVGRDMNITNVHHYPARRGREYEIQEALRQMANPSTFAWDPSLTCFSGTREAHIQEIQSWLDTSDHRDTARLLLIGAPAGSGKTALAHTICEKLRREGKLLASFFFQADSQQSNATSMMAAIIRGLCDTSDELRREIGDLLVKDSTLACAKPVRQFQEIVEVVCALLPSETLLVIVIDALDEERNTVLLDILRDLIPRLPPSFRFIVTTRPEPRILTRLVDQPHVHRLLLSLTGQSSTQDLQIYLRHRLSTTSYGTKITPKLWNQFITKTEGLFLWGETVLNHLENAFDPVAELEDIVAGASTYWLEDEDATKKLEGLYHRILSKLKWTDPRFVEKYRAVVGALVTVKEPLSCVALASLYELEGISAEDVQRVCTILQPLLQNYAPDNTERPIRLLHLSVREYLTDRAPSLYRLVCEDHHRTLSRLALTTIKQELNHETFPILGYSEGDWPWSLDPVTMLVPKIPVLGKERVLEHIWYACRFLDAHTLAMSCGGVDEDHVKLLLEAVVDQPRRLLEVTASMGNVVRIVDLRKLALSLSNRTLDSIAKERILEVDCSVGLCLDKASRVEEALPIAEATVELCRELDSDNVGVSKKIRLCMALRRLGSCLVFLSRSDEGLPVIEEALSMARQLHQAHSEIVLPLLGLVLRTHGEILHCLGRHDESLEFDLESVEIFRQLSTSNPDLWEFDFSTSLNNLSLRFEACDRRDDAICVVSEGIAVLRRLVEAGGPLAEELEYELALSLYNHCVYLEGTGMHEDAVVPGQESFAICRRMAPNAPDTCGPLLTAVLPLLAQCVMNCGRYKDALPLVVEAVAHYKKLAADDPTDPIESTLSDILMDHSRCLTELGVFIDKPGREAIQTFRRLAAKNPDSHLPDLAAALQHLAASYTTFECASDAVLLDQEAVEIYRGLAEKDPAKYESELFHALNDCAINLARKPGQEAAAVDMAQEAVVMIRRLVDVSGTTMDNLANALDTLASCLNSCGRYEGAIAASLEGLEICSRLEEDPESSLDEDLVPQLHHSYGEALSGIDRKREGAPHLQEAVAGYQQFLLKNPHRPDVRRLLENSMRLLQEITS
ncbi:hypothetical protein FA15DRAFT_706549 [Coprinopsis marcescibilis]|uniref:NACHT domain-containing protein n=1 Tax=Coprinopsis marcescibilis TaxID=230819 RepID=A0A5C3KP24_COPMA|nr:hypothetical protein FA15DRAFT_706549 [Coprinopsis marcescibilis]